jgi:acetyl/propionyl-CoA carboxylase alpha subunit
MDLVEWQIRIAEGAKIDFLQEDLPLNGHAIELRVYAEDPENTFLPSIGTLEKYQMPKGPNIRVDNGYYEGQEIPIYYDPMISKLTVWGQNRGEAIQLLKKAILDYKISGVQTTLPFGLYVANHEVFKDGSYSTNFVEKYFYPSLDEDSNDPLAEMIGKAGLKVYLERVNDLTVPGHQGNEWLRKRRF